MWAHLKAHHKEEYAIAMEALVDTGNKRKRQQEDAEARRAVYTLNAPRQETLEQNAERATKYPPNHIRNN